MATEEQTQHDSVFAVIQAGKPRAGQRLTISNRKVTKLGFWVQKWGLPTGDVTFAIRRVSDDGILLSKVWGDAADVPSSEATYEEATFDAATTINEEVRLSIEFLGGNPSNGVRVFSTNDVKAGEWAYVYTAGSWDSYPDDDLAYRYTYSPPAFIGSRGYIIGD